MKIIDRYIIKIFLPVVFTGISLFLIIILSSDFIERLKYYISHHIEFNTIIYLYLLKIPTYFYQILPSAILFATLYTFGYLSSNYEYIALKSAGISLLRLSRPLIVSGFCFFIVAFALNEFVITKINYKMRIFKITRIQKKKSPIVYKNRYNLDINTTSGYTLHIEKFDGDKSIMYGVKILKIGPNSTIVERYDAALAMWQEGKWLLKKCIYRRFKDNKVSQYVELSEVVAPFQDPPQFFTTIKEPADETNFIKYARYIKTLTRLGFDAREERVMYNFKFAYPFVNVIVILIAIPFSIILVRSTTGLNIGIAILLSFLYYIYLELFKAMGTNGKLSPIIAAWFPNISIFLMGLYGITKKN